MLFDVNSKRVDSPTYRLVMYLNKYEPEIIADEKIQFLFKNLKTHFKKLFYTTSHIYKIQKDEEFIEKYDETSVASINLIEYSYYKISTVFDIAYQIADKLIFPTKKIEKDKYNYLEKQFENYAEKLVALQLDWYRNFNRIRNKIVHGGITVNPFYVNTENVKNRICFQAYDFHMNELIESNLMYSNRYNNEINFADNYFVFHTHLLYSYLTDFFEFILIELNKEKDRDLKNLSLNDLPCELFEKNQKTWLLSEVDTFSEITRNLIALRLTGGRLDNLDEAKPEDINRFFNEFPFTMMIKISPGDWVLAESKSKEV